MRHRRRASRKRKQDQAAERRRRNLLGGWLSVEHLEDRRLLALDYGDAPDPGLGTAAGDYQTTADDSGPSHTIVPGLSLGNRVDDDDGTLQNSEATADDNSTL
jgi:hypothetical protein